ncbi:hypothetical protein [Proteus sp. FME41]|uniref:hypothetical protein n=1 Tax=Proteus sp. FME41 TaxID=2742608 RepID=UPI001865F6A1|nr:hypothetical protein [Proteus sp. FME41]
MKVKFIALLLLSFVFSTASAESITKSLIHCDSEFFNQLYQQKEVLNSLSDMAENSQNQAWFMTDKDKSESNIYFKKAIHVDGLSLVGYTTRYFDLEKMGKFYFWGFIIDNKPDEVVKKLNHVKWKQNQDEYSYNALIKIDDQAWQDNTVAVSGIAPNSNSIEKVALLSSENGKSVLMCTLQGNISSAVLENIRPDMKGQ